MNFSPTWQQRDVLGMIQSAATGVPSEHNPEALKRIAVRSGQGCGKSSAMGVAAIWLGLRHENAMLPVTAPTMRQCREVFLTELGRNMAAADPILQRLVTITRTRAYFFKRISWGIQAITASKSEAFQGLHEKNMSILVEEASGVERSIIETIIGTSSQPNNIVILFGNPNLRDCAFFDCFHTHRDRWATYHMNAEESPLVDPDKLLGLAEDFGRDSDIYRVRALGQFPRNDPQSVMSSEDLEACARNNILEYARHPRAVAGIGQSHAKQFGIDFARMGNDESVIYRRSGMAIVETRRFTKTEPTAVVDAAFRMQAASGWGNKDCWFVPDVPGIGEGTMGKFYDAHKQVFEFRGNHKSSDPQYENRLTEAYFHLADLVRRHAVAIPLDNRMIQQLSNRKFFIVRKTGKIILESKDDYKNRGFDSPDRADALVNAFWDGVLAQSQSASAGVAGRRVGVEKFRR